MPTLSVFYGIKIAMFYCDHNPPHFHASYGGDQATFDIDTGAVLDGKLPRRAMKLVEAWQALHRDELRRDWQLARANQPLDRIAPLD